MPGCSTAKHFSPVLATETAECPGFWHYHAIHPTHTSPPPPPLHTAPTTLRKDRLPSTLLVYTSPPAARPLPSPPHCSPRLQSAPGSGITTRYTPPIPPTPTVHRAPTSLRKDRLPSNLLSDTCPAAARPSTSRPYWPPRLQSARGSGITTRYTPRIPPLPHHHYIQPQRPSARTAYLPPCWSTHPHPQHVPSPPRLTAHPDCRVPRVLALPRDTPHPYLPHQPYIVPQRASARTAYLPTCCRTHARLQHGQALLARTGHRDCRVPGVLALPRDTPHAYLPSPTTTTYSPNDPPQGPLTFHLAGLHIPTRSTSPPLPASLLTQTAECPGFWHYHAIHPTHTSHTNRT